MWQKKARKGSKPATIYLSKATRKLSNNMDRAEAHGQHQRDACSWRLWDVGDWLGAWMGLHCLGTTVQAPICTIGWFWMGLDGISCQLPLGNALFQPRTTPPTRDNQRERRIGVVTDRATTIGDNQDLRGQRVEPGGEFG